MLTIAGLFLFPFACCIYLLQLCCLSWCGVSNDTRILSCHIVYYFQRGKKVPEDLSTVDQIRSYTPVSSHAVSVK